MTPSTIAMLRAQIAETNAALSAVGETLGAEMGPAATARLINLVTQANCAARAANLTMAQAARREKREGFRLEENRHFNVGFFVRPDDAFAFTPVRVYATPAEAWEAHENTSYGLRVPPTEEHMKHADKGPT